MSRVFTFRCASCGEEKIGKSSIGGQCLECGKNICYQCRQIKKIRYCVEHEPPGLICGCCGLKFQASLSESTTCLVCGEPICSGCKDKSGAYCSKHIPKTCAECHTPINTRDPHGVCAVCGAFLCKDHHDPGMPFCGLHIPKKCPVCGNYMMEPRTQGGVCGICNEMVCSECWAADQNRCAAHMIIHCGLCGKLIDKSKETADKCRVDDCTEQVCRLCAEELEIAACKKHLPRDKSMISRSHILSILETYFSTVFNHINQLQSITLLHDTTVVHVKKQSDTHQTYVEPVYEDMKTHKLEYEFLSDDELRLLFRNDSYVFPVDRDNRIRIYLVPVIRFHRYLSPGMEWEPVSWDEIFPVLNKLFVEPRHDMYTFYCFISPSGWTESAIEQATHGLLCRNDIFGYGCVDPSLSEIYTGKTRFHSQLMHILRGGSRRDFIDACADFIEKRFASDLRTRLSAREIADESGYDLDTVKSAFTRLKEDKQCYGIVNTKEQDVILCKNH